MIAKKIFPCLLHVIYCLAFLTTLASCRTNNEAPIVDGWKQTNTESSTYRVQQNDTIYSVAWAFGMDYRELARINHLQEPYHLSKGQTLSMSSANSSSGSHTTPDTAFSDQTTGAQVIPQPIAALPIDQNNLTSTHSTITPSQTKSASPSATKTGATTKLKPAPVKTASSAKTTKKTDLKTAQTTIQWLWPTRGTVIRGFSAASGGNKGVDIAGHLAQAILATANGKVVYTGASLPGYGNLIILKHSENELSAYAFNKVIAVKEGQWVKAGQPIAQMGTNDSGKAVLHFEIRQNGRPIDPMPYLTKRYIK